jgi:hypothetical protein
MAPSFDELRAVVAEGDGVVARFPGLLAVASGPDADVRRLLELCRESAGQAPGRGLARRLATWLGGDDAPSDAMRFGTVATTDRGLAVFLRGNVDLLVPDRGTAMAGADAATWTDRLIEAPDVPVALTLQGATAPADLLGGVFDLREGVVPGVAVVALAAAAVPEQPALPVDPDRPADLVGAAGAPPEGAPADGAPADGAPADGAPADGPTTGEQRAAVPPPPVEPPVAPPAPDGATEVIGKQARHRVESGQEPVPGSPAAARAALRAGMAKAAERAQAANAPAGQPPARPAQAAPARPQSGSAPDGEADDTPPPVRVPVKEEEAPKAEGYLCARGHLNDPRVHVCVQCGIPMSESAGGLVVDERPPLGVLVFDDGTTHTVDAGYLLGREPEGDARVRSGVLRPIVLDDRSGAMSRVHAEIRLENWDVVLTDSGSSNGTFVAGPGARAWTTLTTGMSFRLVPGTRVQLGQRNFTFETVAGVR